MCKLTRHLTQFLIFFKGVWDRNLNLIKCVWHYCINAPAAPTHTFLTDLSYNGSPYEREVDEVTVGKSVIYSCGGGMRFNESFDLSSLKMECLQPGNGAEGTWSEPSEWPRCVESEFVPMYRVFESRKG